MRRLWSQPPREFFASDAGFRVAIVLVALAWMMGANHGDRLTLDPLHYAAVARSMAEGGPLVVPEFAGEVYLKKPPLMMWLAAGSMKLFGPTGWAARLPGMLFSVATVLLAARLARRLFDRETALLVVLTLCSTYTFYRSGRTLRLETIVAATTLAALLVHLHGLDRERYPRWAGLAIFGLTAVAWMGKTWAGLMPLGVVILGAPRKKALASPWFWAGAVAFIVPVGAWLLAAHARLGADWTLALAADAEQYEEGGLALGRFFGRMVLDTFLQALPWSPLMVFGAALAIRALFRARGEERRRAWLLLAFPLIIAAGSIMKSYQYSRYWVPALPALAILGAIPLRARFAQRSFAPLAGAATGVVLLAAVALFLLPISLSGEPHRYRAAAPIVERRIPPGERLPFLGEELSIGRQASLYFYSGRWGEAVDVGDLPALAASERIVLVEHEVGIEPPAGYEFVDLHRSSDFRLVLVRASGGR